MTLNETKNANGAARNGRRPLLAWEKRLQEAFDELWNDFVDPAEPFYDSDGTRWAPLGSASAGGSTSGQAGLPGSERELDEIRDQCRALSVHNEFAINGHENRINYIVGTGHSYRVVPKRRHLRRDRADGEENTVDESLIAAAQDVIGEFLEINRWHKRQQELVRRRDRDGEAFLRFFFAPDGTTRIRFVEPTQISTPTDRATDPAAGFGILTDPADVETVLGYYVDGRLVEASEIQHRKANVDANVKRGLPLYYPVRKNLRRAEKLLRNMSVVAEIQSAIALIRKHNAGTRESVEQYVQDGADLNVQNRATGATSHFRRYAPGTILDAFGGTDYEFPAAGLDAGQFISVLQAELRAIAARLVMPEFMLTSDASNANYASTMIAEGPAVRMFQRLQHDMLEDDREVLRRVIEHAVHAGRLAEETLASIEIQATPPTLAVRDRLRETQADQILVRNGAMSVATMSARNGLEPQREREVK